MKQTTQTYLLNVYALYENVFAIWILHEFYYFDNIFSIKVDIYLKKSIIFISVLKYTSVIYFIAQVKEDFSLL